VAEVKGEAMATFFEPSGPGQVVRHDERVEFVILPTPAKTVACGYCGRHGARGATCSGCGSSVEPFPNGRPSKPAEPSIRVIQEGAESLGWVFWWVTVPAAIAALFLAQAVL
jgi:hypothetical protein